MRLMRYMTITLAVGIWDNRSHVGALQGSGGELNQSVTRVRQSMLFSLPSVERMGQTEWWRRRRVPRVRTDNVTVGEVQGV